MVMGHWVKDSPEKMVRPMLSFGRPAINSAATFLAASMRLGRKSSAFDGLVAPRIAGLRTTQHKNYHHEGEASQQEGRMDEILLVGLGCMAKSRGRRDLQSRLTGAVAQDIP